MPITWKCLKRFPMTVPKKLTMNIQKDLPNVLNFLRNFNKNCLKNFQNTEFSLALDKKRITQISSSKEFTKINAWDLFKRASKSIEKNAEIADEILKIIIKKRTLDLPNLFPKISEDFQWHWKKNNKEFSERIPKGIAKGVNEGNPVSTKWPMF